MDITEKAAKWDELLPKLGILRANLFRVDRQLSHLDQELFDRDPVQVIEYTSAFLSVLEFYFPSTEEEALAASELTRLERLGQELSQTGVELKEEVKREFASLKAQVETEIGRLEAENARLRPYTEPRLFAAASDVLAAHDDPGNIEAIEETLVRLDQAVAWWDALGVPGAWAEEVVNKYPVRPRIVCLCGSTRFWRTFQEAGLRETLAGRIVLSIGAASGTDDQHFGNLPKAEYDAVKETLDQLHFRKIELADEVLILNVDGYVGPSTSRELAHARKLGKVVRFWEEEREA